MSFCFRPKIDPVMEEVLEAFAVSVQMFSPYLFNVCKCTDIFEAQRANGVIWLSSPTCPPHPYLLLDQRAFPQASILLFLQARIYYK